jgi:DtxR family Mn-dependent transcriptional regulator
MDTERTALGRADSVCCVELNDLTPVAQDYLKTIWNYREWSEEPVTAKKLALKLALAPSTVSEMIRRLTADGLVEHVPYGAVSLTPSGSQLAVGMVRRHRLLETFLARQLGYGWDEVHDEADALEHVVSDRLIDRIDALLGSPERDPHGDAIPRRDGGMQSRPDRRLSDIPRETPARVSRICDSSPERLRFFDSIGLSLESHVTVTQRLPHSGIVWIRIGSQRLRTPMGSQAADAIWVEPLPWQG